MPNRPLLFVSGLTVGDYLLWNWSLGGNHGMLALVSGLTLPPLAVACGWLIVLNLVRLLISHPKRRAARASHRARTRHASARTRRASAAPARPAGDPSSSTASAGRSSSKLAA